MTSSCVICNDSKRERLAAQKVIARSESMAQEIFFSLDTRGKTSFPSSSHLAEHMRELLQKKSQSVEIVVQSERKEEKKEKENKKSATEKALGINLRWTV